ncbi:MAG: sigma-70 family RNA polymerase sigma factor [Saprospiraceae bacterium]|nr:sigma-70 family RNA polymerase sigma factor [Saprospiraceae bacterium]
MSFIKRNIVNDLSDQDLVTKYQEDGNIQSLCDLYQRYLELVYGVCLKYLNDEASSKDATMEVYEILANKLKSHSVDNFKGWLYSVVKNHCLQILRKQKHQIESLDSNEFMHSDELMHHDSEFELLSPHVDLHQCLEYLPSGQRESIQWFYFEKKSYEEIAKIMQVDREQVRSHIQNARRNLKNCLNKKRNG